MNLPNSLEEAIGAYWDIGFREGCDTHVRSGDDTRCEGPTDNPNEALRKVREEILAFVEAELDKAFVAHQVKLQAGTLHVVHCNGDHSQRVGKEGMICNCTLGQEIHGLRQERDTALATLAQKHGTDTVYRAGKAAGRRKLHAEIDTEKATATDVRLWLANKYQERHRKANDDRNNWEAGYALRDVEAKWTMQLLVDYCNEFGTY